MWPHNLEFMYSYFWDEIFVDIWIDNLIRTHLCKRKFTSQGDWVREWASV